MSNGPKSIWTDELVAKLEKLWRDGLSANQIATKLGLASRNVVIGKIHRLRLNGIDRRGRKPVPRRTKRARKPPAVVVTPVVVTPDANSHRKTIPVPVPREPEPNSAFSYSILALKSGQCRWPADGGPPHKFCGAPAAELESYCKEHLQRSLSAGASRPTATQNWHSK